MAKKIKVIDNQVFEKKEIQNSKKIDNPNNRKNLVILVLLILMIISIILNVIMGLSKNNSNTESKKEEDTKETFLFNLKYSSKIDKKLNMNEGTQEFLEEKMKFYDEHVVFLVEEHDFCYYKYKCLGRKANMGYKFWAVNEEIAIASGLSECSHCLYKE